MNYYISNISFSPSYQISISLYDRSTKTKEVFLRSFSTKKENSFEAEPCLVLDKSKDINSCIYKIYDNFYLNDRFSTNLAVILEDLYDNNEFVEFKLYFVRKHEGVFIINVPKFINHLNKYPLNFILDNIVKYHKNTGIVGLCGILVWLSLCDINNLKRIANDILQNIHKNIININDNIHKDYGNTIVNFKTPMVKDNVELFLFITIDRSNSEMIKNKKEFYKNDCLKQ